MNFYTSDLHFHYKNIVKFSDRHLVVSKEQHNEWLVELWNKQVGINDIVYHLGDFCFDHKLSALTWLVSQLNGRIVLLEGNHDDARMFKKLKEQNLIQNWHQYHSIKIAGNKVRMFHFPIACWNGQHHGTWHLHGHSHGTYKTHGKILDVGLDSAYNILGEHRFFTDEDIINIMATKNTQSNDYHKEKYE